MKVYQFLEILLLIVVSWTLILAFTEFIDSSLIILLGLDRLDCVNPKTNSNSEEPKPKKWLFLTCFYLCIFILFLYYFGHEIHDVFGINV